MLRSWQICAPAYGARCGCGGTGESYLDETNVGGLLAEALTADVQAVLADETGGVGANAAVEKKIVSQMFSASVV